jgi:hypothetical protein
MHTNVYISVRAGGRRHPVLKRKIGEYVVRFGGRSIRVGYYLIPAIDTDRMFALINEIYLAQKGFDDAHLKEITISDSRYFNMNMRIPVGSVI